MKIDYPLESQIDSLRSLWKEAFGDTDAFLDIFWDTAFSPDRCRCITVDGEVAAALYWFDCRYEGRPIAYVYAVATAKAFRKQGLCRALMDDTRLLLLELGYSGIILVPEVHLFGMYESMGYKTCSYVQEFTCRSSQPIALREIDAEEYARLRREFLPAGGVVQENENLQFLSAITKLYAGDGFLYAEDAELLGNADVAPGILAALGKDSGRFRCPGGDIPFAMYLSLDDRPAPTYFGLAFD
ncbi:MAG: GNAT family N-acetyltransferase [Oscillospiraceae bacterium]|nr:GNAT family N-acetyltransferase [Oscillospiraceae bacterium]